jgi:hypothetical protein
VNVNWSSIDNLTVKSPITLRPVFLRHREDSSHAEQPYGLRPCVIASWSVGMMLWGEGDGPAAGGDRAVLLMPAGQVVYHGAVAELRQDHRVVDVTRGTPWTRATPLSEMSL